MERTRTVTWSDPSLGITAATTLSGLEYLRAMARGDAPPPPLSLLMGFKLDVIEEGRVTIIVVPEEYHYNPFGVAHGGFAATLFDSSLGCAVQTLLPPAHAAPTLQIQTNFVRPITIASGQLTCTGEVLHLGKKTATAEGKLTDASGRLYAHATGTFLIAGPEDRKAR